MPIHVYSSLLLFLLLQACNFGENPSSAPPESDTLENARTTGTRDDTGLFHRVADDREAGNVKPAGFNQLDRETGTTYQINPNWGIVQRRPRTEAEVMLPGTNGLIQTYTDWSGQIETRIYECASPAKIKGVHSIGCQVEPDFVLVGGGAYADYGTGAGALIWESRPLDPSLATWVGSSKDHGKACAHTLRVYAFGMRLKDLSGNYIPKHVLVGNYIRMHQLTTSPAASQNERQIGRFDWGGDIGLPAFDTNIGGGARANWYGAGALLTQVGSGKHPQGWTNRVQAMSKDHYAKDLHTLTAYAIAYKPENYMSWFASIPNFGKLQATSLRADGAWVSTGVSVAKLDAQPGWVMTTLGGEGRSTSGAGRPLIGVRPTGSYSGQAAAYAKDHNTTSAGLSAVFFAQVRKVP